MATWLDNLPNPSLNADSSKYWVSQADAGQKQAAYNRPTTYGPFGQSVTGADGSVKTSFSGQFGQLNDALTNQAAGVAANPMDWGQFGTLGTGEDAGRETSQAAYSQSLSRLNPFWDKSERQLRTNLFQAGNADSDAGQTTLDEFGRARNDAYTGAMTDAHNQGMSAQQSAFQGNLQSRQAAVANALRGQTQPFEELQGMQGLLTQPDYNRDNSMLVAAAADNAAAPVKQIAAAEDGFTKQMESRGYFQDSKFDKPGAGERRRKYFESLSPEARAELSVGFGNWGEIP